MEIDIENLPDSPDLLRQIIMDMRSELSIYKEKYTRLIELLRLARQQRFSPSSEKDIHQIDLFDEPGAELPEDVKKQLDEEMEVKGYARKKHPIRTPLPDYLPRETILLDIRDAEKICHCGEHLVRIGEEITEQLKYIPAQVSVIQHVRPKYACKPCEENIKIAPMPMLLLPKSIATPELVAHTIVSKYCDHIPLYRQESIWSRVEIEIPRSTLCDWVLKTAEICKPLVKLLQKIIIAYDYAQADE